MRKQAPQPSSGRSVQRRARVIPTFQSASVVLPALHHLAVQGNTHRHNALLIPAIGHLAVASHAYLDVCYRQALGVAFGARSLAGLESIVLTGLNNALLAHDLDGAKAGLTALTYLPNKGRSNGRPILFLDAPSSLMTVLSVEEFALARARLLSGPQPLLFSSGVGPSVRGIGLPVPANIQSAKFDQSTCRAWVEWAGGVGLVVVAVAGIEVTAGLGIVGRIVGGARILGFGGVLKEGALGFTVGKYFSAPICTGLASGVGWVSGKLGGGGSSSASGDQTSTHVTPDDLGVSPRDFGVPPEGGSQPPKTEGGAKTPEGTVEEGDGFDAVQVNGPTSVTLTGQDGSTSTVTVDSDGNTTVTNTDSNGNVTSVETYDAQGNGQSTDSGGSPPTPDEQAGYPVPDGDGIGGPAGFASLVAYPNPDDAGSGTGHGPTGPAALVGLGATYQLNGLAGLRSIGGVGMAW